MTTATRTALKWDYAPAPESRDAAALRDSYDLYIGGEFVAPGDGTRRPTVNPATEAPLAEVATHMGRSEGAVKLLLHRAVAALRRVMGELEATDVRISTLPLKGLFSFEAMN